MHEFRRHLPRQVGVYALLVCLPLWLAFGAAFAFAALAVYLFIRLYRHLYWLQALHNWLKRPDINTLPTGAGLWEEVFSGLYQEARHQRRSQTQLSSALEHFQCAANALPDGMVLLSAGGQIEWCNPAAEQQLGLDLEQDAGKPIGYLVRQSEFTDYLADGDQSEPIKLTALRTPGTTLQIQLVPFGHDQKLLLCRDVTPMEKLDVMRRDFIANVSHELRTPLTVVGGFLETLADMDSSMPEDTRRYFELMQEQTGRMRHLVEDLLTLSQLESGQQPSQESTLDIPALLELVMREGQSLSAGHHHISLQTDPTLRLRGAQEELHSAFGNLVSNAIRYTPKGGDITLIWQARGSDAVFSVRDTGIGIEAQHLPRLTERFYRVDRSRSRETGGTGLGLSIVKHILTRHQARLEIESEPGRGSTFSAVFPATRVLRKQNGSAE